MSSFAIQSSDRVSSSDKPTLSREELEEEDYLCDVVTQFLASPVWQTPTNNFIDKYCLEFDGAEENKLIYTTIHNEYSELVEKLITDALGALGITDEQFASVVSRGHRLKRLVFGHLLAADDFQVFKSIMVRRNLELGAEAIKHLKQNNESKRKRVASEQEALRPSARSLLAAGVELPEHECMRLAREDADRALAEALQRAELAAAQTPHDKLAALSADRSAASDGDDNSIISTLKAALEEGMIESEAARRERERQEAELAEAMALSLAFEAEQQQLRLQEKEKQQQQQQPQQLHIPPPAVVSTATESDTVTSHNSHAAAEKEASSSVPASQSPEDRRIERLLKVANGGIRFGKTSFNDGLDDPEEMSASVGASSEDIKVDQEEILRRRVEFLRKQKQLYVQQKTQAREASLREYETEVASLSSTTATPLASSTSSTTASPSSSTASQVSSAPASTVSSESAILKDKSLAEALRMRLKMDMEKTLGRKF